MMYEMLNIPAHTRCRNCGECCGIIPATSNEVKTIREYLQKQPKEVQLKVVRQSKKLSCPFRDNEKKKCLIYPVRPIICRLFGVCKGMRCKYGNSANINGHKLLGQSIREKTKILNFERW